MHVMKIKKIIPGSVDFIIQKGGESGKIKITKKYLLFFLFSPLTVSFC
jgi:hypothetical protein